MCALHNPLDSVSLSCFTSEKKFSLTDYMATHNLHLSHVLCIGLHFGTVLYTYNICIWEIQPVGEKKKIAFFFALSEDASIQI